jgi:hypothetical protein
MMRVRLRWVLVLGAASFAGLVAAIGMGSAGAAIQTVTLGSTTGTPSANTSCPSGTDCTYVPFSSVTTPETQVPFDGTVTTFSVNSGSAGGTVWLRVLRPAAGGRFTGAGTSQPEVLNTGANTFTTSLAVKAGDLLALDNDSSALIFDTSNPAAITSYYMPALIDGQSLAPNENQSGIQLLFSATVQSAPSPTTTGPGTTAPGTTKLGTTGPGTGTGHPTPAPALSRVGESHRVWSEQTGAGGSSHPQAAPVGTTFSFNLNERALLRFSFEQQLTGRQLKGRCVPQTPLNRTRRACTRAARPRSLSLSGHAGRNRVPFRGHLSATSKLPAGRYKLSITAVNSAGQHSRSSRLAFTIVSPGVS